MKKKSFIILLAFWTLPAIAFAQTYTIENLINRVSLFANATIPFIIGLAVLVIIWGVFNYIVGAGDEEKRAAAKQYIIWGIIGVFIMISVWGLVNILVGSFALSPTAAKDASRKAVVPGADATGIGGVTPSFPVGSPCQKIDRTSGVTDTTGKCN